MAQLEQLSRKEKIKLKELQKYGNSIVFENLYDKLKHPIFIIIAKKNQLEKYKSKTDYAILIEKNTYFSPFYDFLGYCRAIKRAIKFLNEIETKLLRFDFDNSKYAMTNRKSYLKAKNFTENDKVVIFTFRKNRDYVSIRQKSFKELIH